MVKTRADQAPEDEPIYVLTITLCSEDTVLRNLKYIFGRLGAMVPNIPQFHRSEVIIAEVAAIG